MRSIVYIKNLTYFSQKIPLFHAVEVQIQFT